MVRVHTSLIIRVCACLGVLWLLMLCHSALAASPEAKLTLRTKYARGTLALVTALSGTQLRSAALSQRIDLVALSEAMQAQVFDAAQVVVGPGGSREHLVGRAPSARWAISARAEFYVTLRSPGFGGRGEITIPLSEIVSKPAQETGPSDPSLGSVADPPALGALLSSLPADPDAAAESMRQSIFDILAPAGQLCLSRAAEIPFSIEDFHKAQAMQASALNTRQAEWLSRIYGVYALHVAAMRDKLKELGEIGGTSGSHASGVAGTASGAQVAVPVTVTVGEVAADNPLLPLPEWSAVQDAVILPHVKYTFTISAEGNRDCPGLGVGWAISTQRQ